MDEKKVRREFAEWLKIVQDPLAEGVQEAINFADDHQSSASEWGAAFAWFLLRSSQAEVDRLRGLFEQILAHPEDTAYDARFWRNFAREAIAPKEPRDA